MGLKDAAKRKEHRERSQPGYRKKLGLLEKKKDYRERADDFNKKKRTIKHLRGKADARNPDEFYFAMQRASTKNGVHIARSTQPNKYSQAQLGQMRTQDIAYLRTQMQVETKQIEKLQHSLAPTLAPTAKRTVFVTDGGEEDLIGEDKQPSTRAASAAAAATVQAATATGDVRRAESVKDQGEVAAASRSNPFKGAKPAAAVVKELQRREGRRQKVVRVLHSLELQAALAGKGTVRKLKRPGQAPVYKWKRERQK